MSKVKFTRRQALGTLAAGAGALATSSMSWKSAYAQNSGPLKVGYLAPLSGPVQVIGQDLKHGAEIAVDQINAEGGVMGRKLELVVRDDQGKPDVGVAAARELISAGQKLLVGFHSSATTLAVLPVLEQEKALLIMPNQASPALTHEKFSHYTFRPFDYTVTRQRANGKLAAENFGSVTDWGAIIQDFQVLRDMYDFFKDGTLQYYGPAANKLQFEEPIVSAAASADFRADITKGARLRAKGLFFGLFGGSVITFLRQAAPYKLFERFEVVFDAGSEWDVPTALGKEVPKNYMTSIHWNWLAYEKNPLSAALHAEYVKRTSNNNPQGYVACTHTAVRALASGIKRAQSTETEAVIKAMEGMSFDTVKNKITLRAEDHQGDADINFVQFAPDEDSKQGWKVTRSIIIPGAGTLPPPSPGKPYAMQFFKG